MSIYLDQIEKRKRLEEATLIETFEKATKRLGIWNDYLVCRSLLNENKNPTLMVGINGFFGARAMEFGYAFAGIILVSLPMIILFLCLQKYFIKGIAAGAVKG